MFLRIKKQLKLFIFLLLILSIMPTCRLFPIEYKNDYSITEEQKKKKKYIYLKKHLFSFSAPSKIRIFISNAGALTLRIGLSLSSGIILTFLCRLVCSAPAHEKILDQFQRTCSSFKSSIPNFNFNPQIPNSFFRRGSVRCGSTEPSPPPRQSLTHPIHKVSFKRDALVFCTTFALTYLLLTFLLKKNLTPHRDAYVGFIANWQTHREYTPRDLWEYFDSMNALYCAYEENFLQLGEEVASTVLGIIAGSVFDKM
jgi:hypothetical protein